MRRSTAETIARTSLVVVPVALILGLPALFDLDAWYGPLLGAALIFGHLWAFTWLPDLVGEFAERKALPSPEIAEPTQEANFTRQQWEAGRRFDLSRDYQLWLGPGRDDAWAGYIGLPSPHKAETADAQRYHGLALLILGEVQEDRLARRMLGELQLLFAKVVLNHLRESEFFRCNEPHVIALRLRVYCEARLADEDE